MSFLSRFSAVLLALSMAFGFVPAPSAQAVTNQSGWDFGLTKRCVKSPLPGQTNYYQDTQGCGPDGKSWTIANQVEFGGQIGVSQFGPATQSFPINQAGSPLSFGWKDLGNGRINARLTTAFDNTVNAIPAGLFTWFSFLDHTDINGGPIARGDQLNTKVRVTYVDGRVAGTARGIAAWQGFWNNSPYQIEIGFNISDNWGDNFPNDPLVIDAFPFPPGGPGKFMFIDGRQLSRLGAKNIYAPSGQATDLEIEWNKIIPALVAQGYLPVPPNYDFANTASQASYMATEFKNDVQQNAGRIELTISNFENYQVLPDPAPPLFSPNGGTFLAPVTVTANVPAGYTMYYTTDGSAPTMASSVFSGSITLNKTTTITSVLVKGKSTSLPVKTVYTINIPQPPSPVCNNRTICFSSPAKNDQWLTGRGYTVSWDPSMASTYPYVNLELRRSTDRCRLDPAAVCPAVAWPVLTLAEKLTNSGKFSWAIPTKLPDAYRGSGYLALSSVEGKVLAASDDFSIVANATTNTNTNTSPDPSSPDKGQITTTQSKAAVVGQSYEQFFLATPTANYIWDIASGQLPAGLTLRDVPVPAAVTNVACQPDTCPIYYRNQARLVGTPTAAGVYNFVLRATSEAGSVITSSQTISVGPVGSSTVPPVPVNPITPPANQIQACSDTTGSGYLVRGSDGTISLVNGGYRYDFTSREDFERRGFRFAQVDCAVPAATLQSVPATSNFSYPTGINFKYDGNPTVYYLDASGQKVPYPSPAFFKAWKVSTSDIITLPADAQYPDSVNPMQLPSGTTLKVDGDPTVYQLENSKLRPFSSARAFISRGLRFPDILNFNPGDRARLGLTVGDIIE